MKGRTLVLAGLVALTTAAAGDARAPRNGLVSFWTGTGTPAVWVMRPDGSGRRLVTRFKQSAKRGSFSPDGRLLVFDGTRTATGRREDFDVQVVRLDGTGRRWLTRAFREEDRVRSRRRRLPMRVRTLTPGVGDEYATSWQAVP
jgi:hypothetical protein